MLNQSILGALYRCWLGSGAFALLRRVWRALAGVLTGSRLGQLLFGLTRLDAWFSRSLAARGLRRLLDWAVALLRAVCNAARHSVICGRLAPALRSSRILRYEFLLGAFCCVMFIVPHDSWNNLYAVAAAAVFLLLYLLSCGAGHRKLDYPDTLGLGFALFALAYVLSMLFTADSEDSLRILSMYLASFVLCWLIAVGFDNPVSLRRLMGFLYLSMMAVSLYGIAQRALNLVSVVFWQTDMSINQGVPGRIYASLDNPNNLSGFLQLFLPLGAAHAAGTKSPTRRFLLTLGLVVPAVAMVMTYSRSGWLAILLSAAVYVYLREKRLLPALLVAAVLAVPLLPASVLTRLDSITNAQDTSRNHRLAIWEGVLRLLGDKGYWLTGIGIGPGAFNAVYPNYGVGIGLEGAYHSQMLYLELDLELGILGFLAFLWMCLKYIGRLGHAVTLGGGGRENRLVLCAGLASFAGLAVSATAEFLWFYQRLIFAYFIWLGVILAALRIAERPLMGKNFFAEIEKNA